MALRKQEGNYREKGKGEKKIWHDYVCSIDYRGYSINLAEYGETDGKESSRFCFLTDLSVTEKNIKRVIWDERKQWKIENEGFNCQKNHGY